MPKRKRPSEAEAPVSQPPTPADQPTSSQLPNGAGDPPESFHNSERVLILSARGITPRYRHLMLDLLQLLPHSKKDVKLDTKRDRQIINEVAELRGCSSALFFECRKKRDLYLWLARTPEGPSFKFHVTNIHTMAELKLSGNHLKGSRHVVAFSPTFNSEPHWQLCKEALQQVFTVPRRHPKSKPFHDHVLLFSVAEGRLWLRNYQVVTPGGKGGGVELVEVGPRCCLQLVRVFEGAFGGKVLYENPEYVAPNAVRRALKARTAAKYARKVQQKGKRKGHKEAN